MDKYAYTGHLFEEEVLGTCQVAHSGYMTYRVAAETVRTHQPARKAPVAARLEREVGAQLGGAVKFFTAVRSALDFFHGVDGFFEFNGVVVTIDLTMNPHKDHGKADIIVCKDDVSQIGMLAGRIAREMKSRLSRRG